LRTRLEEQAAQAQASEEEVRQIEAAIQELETAIHDWETRLGQARQQIAASEATATHEASLSSDLETQLARTQLRLGELSAHVTTLSASTARSAEEWRGAEELGQRQRESVANLEADLQAASQRLRELHLQIEEDKNEHLEQMRHAGRLHNDA